MPQHRSPTSYTPNYFPHSISATPHSPSHFPHSSSHTHQRSTPPTPLPLWTHGLLCCTVQKVVGVLQQVYAPLSRAGDTQVLMRAAHWNLEMAQTDGCHQHYAETETDTSCWNTAVSGAVTYLRRAGDTESADAVTPHTGHGQDIPTRLRHMNSAARAVYHSPVFFALSGSPDGGVLFVATITLSSLGDRLPYPPQRCTPGGAGVRP